MVGLSAPQANAQEHSGHSQQQQQTGTVQPSESTEHSQHQHGSMSQPEVDAPSAAAAQEHAGHEMHRMEQDHATGMELGFSSGTAWAPLEGPEYMWMAHKRAWMLMAHGNVFLSYNQQGGPRGAAKLQSMNWLMFMEQRRIGSGTLQLRQMLSAEPLTAPRPGFPQLFQTGETYKGRPLIDHQHPHDVFGEISARYTMPVGENWQWSVYGGPAAEPAIGPVAFMHRVSALDIPDAPLSHHLQDSTHITFGVITTGLAYKRLKVEGSAFNAREPDEDRYNFDFAPMDSMSGRISYAPSKNWALQYSFAHLRKPEEVEPNTNINRQTASIMYTRQFGAGYWASSLVWGRNQKMEIGHEDTHQNSYLLESTVNFAQNNYAFTRMELLDRDELFEGDGPFGHHSAFRIGAYTFGATRDLVQSSTGQLGLGASVTFYSKPEVLDTYYGKNPVSFQIFLRVRPPRMTH